MVKKKLVRPNQDPRISLKKETKAKLDKLKTHPRATYDEVIDNVASQAITSKAEGISR